MKESKRSPICPRMKLTGRLEVRLSTRTVAIGLLIWFGSPLVSVCGTNKILASLGIFREPVHQTNCPHQVRPMKLMIVHSEVTQFDGKAP